MDGEEDEGYYDIRGEEDTPNVGSSVVDSSTTPVVTSPATAAEAGSSSSSSSSSWLPILESSNQLVLYNPYSHALTITPTFLPPVLVSSTVRGNGGSRGHGARENEEEEGDGQSGSNGNRNGVLTTRTIGNDRYRDENGEEGGDDDDLPVLHGRCPLCSRPFSTRAPLAEDEDHTDDEEGGRGIIHGNGGLSRGTGTTRGTAALSLRRASNYFQLLETSFEAQKRRVPAPPLLSAPAAPATIASPSSPSSPFISVVPSPSSEVVDGIGTPHYTTNSTNTSSTTIGYGKGKAASSIPSRAVRGGGGAAAAAAAAARMRVAVGFGNEDSRPATPQARFSENSMAQGYFAAFFKEEKRLGMGANGTVYLCQHILNGNYLGHFAVKKIAVGHSQEYLLRILKEVRLLETLRHPNIITYHHSWLESTRFSSFGPSIPTLHVLMEWAECGSLDDLIDARLGKRAEVIAGSVDEDEDTTSRSARIRAFKAAKEAHESGAPIERNRGRSSSIAVHMLNAEEIKSYLSDVVSGLAFLHDRSILHLDLKLGNVLLTRDEERTIPRAMLSDFGTSQDALQTARVRSGNTGTVEYSAPEALLRDQSGSLLQLDSKSDMWSLGMILHKLIFLRLPYPDLDASDVNGIEREVLAYPGWKATTDVIASCKRRGLPRATLLLLESLLNRNPRERPSSERVLHALREGTTETHSRSKRKVAGPIVRRRSSSSGDTRSISPLTIRRSPEVSISHQDEAVIPPSSPLISTLQTSKRLSVPNTIAQLLLPFPLRVYAYLARTRWRTFRSCLLVLKILSLSTVCQHSYPLLWIQSVVIACAVLDVWQENEEDGRGDLRISFALLFVHFFILGIVRLRRSQFCLA